jgi:hypothetical protein
MGACDIVVSNLTIIYLAILACLKVYGVIYGLSYGFMFVMTFSTTIVVFIFVGTIMWDLFEKFNTSCVVFDVPQQPRIMSSCKGGICWHGVADSSSASKISFKLPLHDLPPHVT